MMQFVFDTIAESVFSGVESAFGGTDSILFVNIVRPFYMGLNPPNRLLLSFRNVKDFQDDPQYINNAPCNLARSWNKTKNK